MDIWNSLMGEILKCKRESANEVDKHAVAIMRSNSLDKNESSDTFHKNIPHDPFHLN